MKYNNRLYPHPVLGIEDDVDGIFQGSFNFSADNEVIKIGPQYKLSNDTLELLIKDEKAEYVMQLYCRSTMYRKTFNFKSTLPDPIVIPSTKFREKVEFDFLICASEQIKNYQNSGSSPDYEDFSFNIEKGDILAYGGMGHFFANKAPEELKSVSSFMNIDTSGKKNSPMYNSYDGDKITIMLSQDDYEEYQVIQSNPYFVSTLHSSIVLPALVEALNFMDSSQISDYKDHIWYELLNDLKSDNEKGAVGSLQIAQNILDLPISRSFESMKDFLDAEE